MASPLQPAVVGDRRLHPGSDRARACASGPPLAPRRGIATLSAPAKPRAVPQLPAAGAGQGAFEGKRTKQTGDVRYRDQQVRRGGQWHRRGVAEFMQAQAGRFDIVDVLLIAALSLLAAMLVWEPYWAHG